MLTQLRLQGFKSWRDTGEMRFAPLTGLFGTNSSGKTSVLQFLRLLRYTAKSNNYSAVFDLRGELFQRDSDIIPFSDIVHRNLRTQSSQTFGYSLTWNLINSLLVQKPVRDKTINYYRTDQLKFDADLRRKDDGKLFVQSFKYSFSDLDSVDQFECGMEIVPSTGRYIVTKSDPPYLGKPRKGYCFPEEIRLRSDLAHLPHLVYEFESILWRIIYLGPLREFPRPEYTCDPNNQPSDVGQKGENAVRRLLASGKDAQTKVTECLSKLGLVESFRLVQIVQGRDQYEIKVKRKSDSAEVLLPDVGFGVSQILPVLVQCFTAPKGAILIFEQPEIHLHPSVQAGLADVFIDAIKTRNVQIIVESHSEHFLRRLQRRIAEEQFDENDAALYFTSIEDGESKLTPLELDQYGSINNWPQHFFGDDMGDMVAMTKAAMKRQIAEQNGAASQRESDR